MSIRRVLAGRQGSILLEALIVGLVLGIAMVGLSLMFSGSQTMVIAQGDKYVALYLAQQTLEQCLGSPYSKLGVALGPCPNQTETISATGESGLQTFTRQTTVTAGGTAGTTVISVTVTPSLVNASPVTLTALAANVQ